MKAANRCYPIFLLLFGALLLVSSAAFAAQLLGSGSGVNDHPHNLSSSSTATIHSTTEDRICVFCHTPHGSSSDGPLWNRSDPLGPNGDGTFPLYSGAEAGLETYGNYGVGTYPNGASRLCMSCHDGYTAVGEVINGGVLDAALNDTITNLGSAMAIDLSGAHPISFEWSQTIADDAYTNRFDLTNILSTILDANGYFQCTGCHDPHNDTDNGTYTLPMWRHYSGNETTDYNETCESCHKSAPAIGGLPH